MKKKFSVRLKWWFMVMAFAVSVPSALLGAPPTRPERIKLLKLSKPSKILNFNSTGELKLLLQQPPAYPGIINVVSGLTAVNADPVSKRVWAVSMCDAHEPFDQCDVGFQTTTLRNTGSSSVSGVTVTVTANMLKLQSANGWNIQLEVIIFKDGRPMLDICSTQRVNQSGTQSVTSLPFTMEPNHDYCAVGEIQCASGPTEGEIVSVMADITDIKWSL